VKPTATIRTRPEDFFVEELPLYEPSGQGDHVFLRIRKTDWTTSACIRQLAKRLEISPDGFGHAGMKDRHAVTLQTLSFPWSQQHPIPELSQLQGDGIEVIEAVRNPQKLRVGHLLGNRFEITLRDVAMEALSIEKEFDRMRRQGVPNAFGPQRFGRDGDNAERTLGWLRGENRGPRDRRMQKLMLSSVQAMLFDRLLEKRVEQGTWNTVLAGDLVKTVERGGLFLCESPEEDAARAQAGEVSATGPIFGPRMRWPEGEPARLESEVLESALGGPDALKGLEKVGAGSRRALRILPRQFEYEIREDGKVVIVRMVLPKGAYATTVLGSIFRLRDASELTRVASDPGSMTDSSSFEELSGDSQGSSR
jgi:tRNA pseudouridine13 synthase